VVLVKVQTSGISRSEKYFCYPPPPRMLVVEEKSTGHHSFSNNHLDCDYCLTNTAHTRVMNMETKPFTFTAMESMKKEDCVEPEHRHELESFIWILAFVCLRYNNGKAQNWTLVDAWMTSSYVHCAEKSARFWASAVDLMELTNKVQPGFKNEWDLAWQLVVDAHDSYPYVDKQIAKAARNPSLTPDIPNSSQTCNTLVDKLKEFVNLTPNLHRVEELVQELGLGELIPTHFIKIIVIAYNCFATDLKLYHTVCSSSLAERDVSYIILVVASFNTDVDIYGTPNFSVALTVRLQHGCRRCESVIVPLLKDTTGAISKDNVSANSNRLRPENKVQVVCYRCPISIYQGQVFVLVTHTSTLSTGGAMFGRIAEHSY